jgi:hypothetical protein
MDEYELIWEQVVEPGSPPKRVGKSKTTGITLLEVKLDREGREIEKRFFHDDGQWNKRIVYEYDQARRPLLITAFDANGTLLLRHERGKRPELFE